MPSYDLTINVVGKDKSSSIFSKLSGGLAKMLQITGGIVAARVFLGLADQIGSVVRAAINATAQFQNMQIGLEGLVARELAQLTDGAQTIADVFPQAQGVAADLMDELARISIVSPYMVEAVMNTFRMQMAFGFTTDQAMKMTDGLLNMAAGIGATDPMLQRMAYNLAQINLQGKVTKLDIRQLALAGLGLVDVLKFVGKEMGVNIETHLDFNKAIASGQITWEDFANAFQKYGQENFAGAAERMARTLYGLKSTFNDVFVLTMPKVLGPAVESVTKSLNKILDIFIFFRESGLLEEWGNVLGGKVEDLLIPFNDFADHILKVLELNLALKNNVSGNVIELEQLRLQLEKLSPTGDVIYDALYATFGPETAEWYSTIRGWVEKLIDVFQWFRLVMGRVREQVFIVFGGLAKFWENYGTRISDAVWRIVDALFELGGAQVTNALGEVETFAERIATWLEGTGGEWITTKIEEFADWLIETGIPTLKEWKAWLEEKIPEAMETLSNFWYETLKPAWEDIKTTWDTKIMPGFQNLKDFWDENGDALLEVLGNFVAELLGIGAENTAGNIEGLGDAFYEGTKDMLENGPEIVENLANITENISNLVDTLTSPEFIEGAAGWAKFVGTLWIASTIINSLSGLAKIFGWLGPLLLGTGKGAGVLATGIKSLALWLPGAAAGLWAFAGGMSGILAAGSWGALVVIGAKIQEKMDEIRENLREKIMSQEVLDEMIENGKILLEGLIPGAGEAWETFATWFIDTLTGWLVGIITGDATAMGPLGPIGFVLNEAGENLAQGLWDGFAAVWADFEAWVSEQWLALQGWWDEIWDNHSPSGVTERMGRNIGEGLIVGLQATMMDVQRTLGEMGPQHLPSGTTVYDTVSIPVNIGTVSSDVDMEELWIRLAERERYERAMRRR